MKEATGELNMTVVTVVAIAAVAAFFYAFIWPSIKINLINSTKCSATTACTCSGNTCSCTYIDENNTAQTITCPNNNDTKNKK